MNRDDFLARVRQAAVAGRAHRVKTRNLPATAGYVGCGPDRCVALAAEIEAVGGEAIVVDDDHAARQRLGEILAEIEPASAFCWEHPLLERLGVAAECRQRGIACHTSGPLAALDEPQRRQAMLAAEVGISSVDYAVGETGSLVVCSRPGQERMVSLLPPVHIALIDEEQILADLYDVFDRLGACVGLTPPETLPSNVAFITGPSKTGDIELQLTTGVHGPGRWIAVMIRSAG